MCIFKEQKKNKIGQNFALSNSTVGIHNYYEVVNSKVLSRFYHCNGAFHICSTKLSKIVYKIIHTLTIS